MSAQKNHNMESSQRWHSHSSPKFLFCHQQQSENHSLPAISARLSNSLQHNQKNHDEFVPCLIASLPHQYQYLKSKFQVSHYPILFLKHQVIVLETEIENANIQIACLYRSKNNKHCLRLKEKNQDSFCKKGDCLKLSRMNHHHRR